MESNWVKVYASTKLHNVELLRNILEEKDLRAIVVNKQDSFYPSIGEIELYVKSDEVMAAKRIIEESAL